MTPLSNLDAKLRIEMRSAIREVQHQVGITTVYVTHDQEEALAISDRIAVMKSGVIQQVGTPERIYSRPANTFVSTFIGHSNLFHATICKEIGFTGICLANGYRIGWITWRMRPKTARGQWCPSGRKNSPCSRGQSQDHGNYLPGKIY